MKLFNVLLKKELLTQLMRGGGKKKDALGYIVTTLISLVFLALFVYLFVAFQSKFEPLNLVDETLTLFVAAGIIAQIIFSVSKAGAVLYGGADAKVILPLPISNLTMLAAKLAALWIKEIINSAFFILPVFVAFGIMRSLGAVYYMLAAAGIIIASLFVVSVSAMISPLYVKVKNFLLKKPYMILAASLVFLAALFAVYSRFLSVVSDMLIGNRMKFIFNKNVADTLRVIAKHAFFAKQLTDFAGGSILGFIIVLFTAAAFSAGAYFISSRFYLSYLMAHAAGRTKAARERPNKERGVTATLINKELTEIFRNPSYLFSYLSVLLTLPLFCYLSVGVLNELVVNLIGGDFLIPFALLITVMFSCVCNTGAGDVISREENKIMIVKTIPVSYTRQIGVKVGIALVIAGISDLLTVFALLFSGTLGAGACAMLFLITFAATAASVMNLVSKDIKNPVVASGAENSNVSVAVVRSLIVSFAMGAVCFVLHGIDVFFTYSGSRNALLTAAYNFTQAIGGVYGVLAIILALCIIDAAVAAFRLWNRAEDKMKKLGI
ncbi:MAG: hypothetical protein IJR61_02925 [Clostridia bacterium]|nr:hypothetical protein [Clostridia bacterium]